MRLRVMNCGVSVAAATFQAGPRHAISLVEILVSIGILAVGLLGVAALFPVGGHFLRQGDISDRADAIAQAAHGEALARGVLDPDRWIMAGPFPEPPATAARVVYGRAFGDFSRSSVAEARETALTSSVDTAGATAEETLSRQIGGVYFIDPGGVAELLNSPNGDVDPNEQFFPASKAVGFTAANAAWRPWAGVNGVWPVRRLSVDSGASLAGTRPPAPYTAQAEAMVGSADDLAIELNNYQNNPFSYTPDSPSQQRWDSRAVGGGGVAPVKRLNRGDYSWAMTVVPPTPDARNALAESPQSHAYDVSAVVFRKRASEERLVRAAVVTRGVSGGSLRLYRTGGEIAGFDATSPLEDVRPGQWVMLFGPQPGAVDVTNPNYLRPVLFCQWYRVVALEDPPPVGAPDHEPAALATVFVRGSAWPWSPVATPDGAPVAPAAAIASDLRMVIAPDVVAVHTRSMKIEPGAAWDID